MKTKPARREFFKPRAAIEYKSLFRFFPLSLATLRSSQLCFPLHFPCLKRAKVSPIKLFYLSFRDVLIGLQFVSVVTCYQLISIPETFRNGSWKVKEPRFARSNRRSVKLSLSTAMTWKFKRAQVERLNLKSFVKRSLSLQMFGDMKGQVIQFFLPRIMTWSHLPKKGSKWDVKQTRHIHYA